MMRQTKKLHPCARTVALLCAVVLLLTMAPFVLHTEVKAEESGSRVIVSLGDSYSSGEGIPPFYGTTDENGNARALADKYEDPDWLAHRSTKSWGGMLTLPGVDGTMADHRNENWFFAAASGAETKHMTEWQPKPYFKRAAFVTHDRFGNTVWPGSYLENSDAKLAPQLEIFDQLGGREVDYITLSLGGNDAGFSTIIEKAVTGSTYLKTSSLAEELKQVWNRFYESGGIRDRLYEAYYKIHEKAPEAKIIVAGYPRLLDEDGRGALISQEEAKMINDSVTRFNKEIEMIVNQCKSEGMKICFVSVEEEFKGHGAYCQETADHKSYLNKVMFVARSEDLNDTEIASAYSMHPNEDGAAAYARCVQRKIDAIEKDGGKSEWPDISGSDERDIVLTLDVSGSMSGTPIEETQKAAQKFIQTVLKEDASIGIVTYDSSAMQVSDFNRNESYLTQIVSRVNTGGGTNIDDGLTKAERMLNRSRAKKKIIVLMSDGDPNEGRTGESLIEYADQIKSQGIYIYTLGFFGSMSGKTSAQTLMERIASPGCHYEVDNADHLVYFFGDIADQIRGQKYIYIRIACPVDVTVKHGGETLTSKDQENSQRAAFGSLTFEENREDPAENSPDDRVKVLRLKDGEDYDIQIHGNAKGKMNYTIGFMDDDGEYSDLRNFKNVRINKNTVVDTVAKNAKTTVLKVDQDGDGKYDLTYKAKENKDGEIVDYTIWIYIGVGVGAALILLVAILVLRKKIKKRKAEGKRKKAKAPAPLNSPQSRPFGTNAAPGQGIPPRPVQPPIPKAPPAAQPKMQPPAAQPKMQPPASNAQPAAPRGPAKFCRSCGSKLVEGAAFCPKCGTKTKKE